MAIVEPYPFHFEMDWTDRFREEREHETTIQGSWDVSEQRRNLSEVPNRRFSYLVKCLEIEHDELQQLQARIWGGQHLLWWVPYWPRERFLTGPVSEGGTSLPVASTVHMGFEVGQGALLYRNPSIYEVVVVEEIEAASVTVGATISAWTAKDKVIPCFRGYMDPESAIIDHDVDLGSATVTFDLDIHLDD